MVKWAFRALLVLAAALVLAPPMLHAQTFTPIPDSTAPWWEDRSTNNTLQFPSADAACYNQWQTWSQGYGTTFQGTTGGETIAGCKWSEGGPLPTAVYLTCPANTKLSNGMCIRSGEHANHCECPAGGAGSPSDGPVPQVGNPISTADGAKVKSVTDYATADGLFRVDRNYRSLRGRDWGQLTKVRPYSFGPNWFGVLPGILLAVDTGGHMSEFEYVSDTGGALRFEAQSAIDHNNWTFITRAAAKVEWSIVATPSTDRVSYFRTDPSVPNGAGEVRLSFGDGSYILFRRASTYSQYRVLVPVEQGFTNGYKRFYDYSGTGVQPTAMRDGFGRQMTLTWATPTYSTGGSASTEEGVITTIGLPDGTSLAYTYDNARTAAGDTINNRLSQVQRLSSTNAVLWARTYLHEDTRFPRALTGERDQNNARLSTYSYNGAQLAQSSELAGAVNKYQVAYSDEATYLEYFRSTVTNPLGRATAYTYYRKNWGDHISPILTSITGSATANVPADSQSFSYFNYNYNSFGLLSQTDANGNVTNFGVDQPKGRPTQVNEAVGTSAARATAITWDATRNLPASEARSGLTVSYTYSPAGQMLTRTETDTTTQTVPYSTNGQARTWTYTWMGTGKIASVNGPKPLTAGKDDTLTFGYDAVNGNLLTSTNGLSQVTTFAAYDANGRPGTMTDSNAIVTAFTYDPLGRTTVINVKHPTAAASDAITALEYDIEGRVIGITRPGTDKLIVDYNLAGQVTSVRAASGERIDYVNNAMGGVTSETVKRIGGTTARQITRTFDELNRMLTETLGPSRTMTWAYDKNGNASQMTSARSAATTFAFDGLNRLVSSVAPDTGATAEAYDPRDNPTAHTDAVAVQTTYVRNGFGEVIQEVSPDRGTSTYYYNAAGELTAAIDGRGQRVDYTRDILGRVLTKTPVGQPASQIVTYSYDANGLGSYQKGRLTRVVDGSGTTLFQYDHRGNMLVKRQAIGTTTAANLTYAYDLADRVTQITYPSGRLVGYVRDSKGRVTTVRTKANSGVANWTNMATSMAYEAFGSLKTAALGNALSMTVDWGNDGRLASRRLYVTSGGANRSLLTYAYDNDDNITAITDGVDATQSVAYVHDTLNRLTRGVTSTGTYKRTDYVLDKNGNRSSVERRVNAGDASAAQTDTYMRTTGTNRLASVTTPAGTRTINYDGRGNTATEARPASVTATVTYDGYGRLTGYTRTGDATQANVYNGLDDRVTVTSGSTTRRYLYDGDGRLLGEYGASAAAANVVAEWIWLEPEAANDNAFGGDEGTGGYAPIGVAVGSAGTLNWVHTSHLGAPIVYTTSAGAVTTAPAALLPGFPGQLRTFADLYYNRYRDYDPTTGRYIQADPIGLAGGENIFLYAEANPLRYTDPSGRFVPAAVVIGIGIGIAIDLGIQAFSNWRNDRNLFDYRCYDWASVAISGGLGAFGGGLGSTGRIAGRTREFSHWIPERYIRPLTRGGNPNPSYKPWLDNPFARRFLDSTFNGNFVSPKFHAVTDPYRYLKGMTKADNLPAPIQQFLRLPSWLAVPSSGTGIAVNVGSRR